MNDEREFVIQGEGRILDPHDQIMAKLDLLLAAVGQPPTPPPPRITIPLDDAIAALTELRRYQYDFHGTSAVTQCIDELRKLATKP